MHIHCITRHDKLIPAIAELNGVKKVTHDQYLDTAVHWSARKNKESPDLIFCEEFAINSKYDKKTKKINKDLAILTALKEIRFNLPNTRIIILLHINRKKDKEFIISLVSLGIYDFHFMEYFKAEQLESLIFSKEKNIGDVRGYFNETYIPPRQEEEKIETVFIEETKEDKPSIFTKAKDGLEDFKNSFNTVLSGLKKEKTESYQENAESKPKMVIPKVKLKDKKKENIVKTSVEPKEEIEKTRENKEQPIKLSKPSFFIGASDINSWRTRAYIIVGVNKRVGSTSFALALGKVLSEKTPVEVIDAGGGASRWVNENIFHNLNIRKGLARSVTPGILTLIDVGTQIPEDALPLIEGVFLVTDLSKNSLILKDYGRYKCMLVGNRGASMGGLLKMAELWNFDVLCTLPEDNAVKKAEMNNKIPMPRAWRKILKNNIKIVENY